MKFTVFTFSSDFVFHPVPRQLPCGHEYCKSCVAQLREKGVAQTCPLCRKPLPPGPDKLFDLGFRMYSRVVAVVNLDQHAPWENVSLSPVQQRQMDQSRALLREAADQGHMMAQAIVGDLYDFGRGVATDDRLAFVYHEKAARQGWAISQFNAGNFCRDGRGCEQSYERAAEWFEKAAAQGDARAQGALANLYYDGRGVPRSYERAIELFKQSAEQGHAISTRNLGLRYELGQGVTQDYKEARRLYALALKLGHTPATEDLQRIDEKIRAEVIRKLIPLVGKRE